MSLETLKGNVKSKSVTHTALLAQEDQPAHLHQYMSASPRPESRLPLRAILELLQRSIVRPACLRHYEKMIRPGLAHNGGVERNFGWRISQQSKSNVGTDYRDKERGRGYTSKLRARTVVILGVVAIPHS